MKVLNALGLVYIATTSILMDRNKNLNIFYV